MTSTFTTNKYIEQPASGDYASGWATPVNNDWAAIDTAFGGSSSVSVTGASGTVTWTTSNIALYRPLTIVFTGTLSANVVYQLPSGVGGQWVVYNNTSGSYTLTFGSAGGGSNVIIPSSTRVYVSCDGTNVYVIGNTVLNQNQSFMRNRFINGAMNISQRGTSFSSILSTGSYTLDRWIVSWVGAAITASQSSGAPNGFSNSLAITGAAGNSTVSVAQRIESYNVQDFIAGATITISGWFYQTTGSSISPTTNAFAPSSKDNYTSTTSISSTASFGTVPNSTWTYLTAQLLLSGSGTSGTQIVISSNAAILNGAVFAVSGLQAEIGQFATAFERRQIGTEFSLCQRYYFSGAAAFTGGYTTGSVTVGQAINYPVSMRTVPTLIFVTTTLVNASGASFSYTAPTSNTATATATAAAGYYYIYATIAGSAEI